MCVNCSFLKHKTALQEMQGASKLISCIASNVLASVFFFFLFSFFSLCSTNTNTVFQSLIEACAHTHVNPT